MYCTCFASAFLRAIKLFKIFLWYLSCFTVTCLVQVQTLWTAAVKLSHFKFDVLPYVERLSTREFSPKFLITASAFCQQLIPCLAGNLNLARVCRNLNSWGCKVEVCNPWWFGDWCSHVSLGCTTMFKATEMQMCVGRLMMAAVCGLWRRSHATNSLHQSATLNFRWSQQDDSDFRLHTMRFMWMLHVIKLAISWPPCAMIYYNLLQ